MLLYKFKFPKAFPFYPPKLVVVCTILVFCQMPSARLKGEKLFAKNPTSLSMQNAETPNRRFKLHKNRQRFIRTHNETLSIITMRVCNPDRSPVGINR
jgi:hypothetical protein